MIMTRAPLKRTRALVAAAEEEEEEEEEEEVVASPAGLRVA
jgi:hypothetical protein